MNGVKKNGSELPVPGLMSATSETDPSGLTRHNSLPWK
jgi:hypothetical protein